MFITFEGPEGSGKSTQILRLRAFLEARGHSVICTREPGGTTTGERIRSVLLDLDAGPLQPETETLLFCAARKELMANVVLPALEAGRIVLCDRFADATLAYQGYGRGMDLEVLRVLNGLATGGCMPDLTLLLDLEVEVGLRRRKRDEAGWNRFDAASLAFHERVRAGYLALAEQEPERWALIRADAPPEAVSRDIERVVGARL